MSQKGASQFWIWIKRLLWAPFPSLPLTAIKNRYRVKDKPDGKDIFELITEWEPFFDIEDTERSERREIAILLYEQVTDELGNLESKAVGILTAIAIIAAGGFVAVTGTSPGVGVALAGFLFIFTSAVACCSALYPKPMNRLSYRDLDTPSGGYAEIVAATRMMEPMHTRKANLLASAGYDLIRASLCIAVALGFYVTRPTTPAEPAVRVVACAPTPHIKSAPLLALAPLDGTAYWRET